MVSKTAICCLTATAVVVWRNRDVIFSLILKQTSEGDDHLSSLVRSEFRATPVTTTSPNKEHTHGVSSAARADATAFAIRFAKSVGLDPYAYQMSKSDQARGISGSRTYFWTKDLDVDVTCDTPAERSMRYMIDVDYYVDMHAHLTTNFAPHILYTLQPKAAASTNGEESFTFTNDNHISMSISGGGTYQHKIWNYQQDHIKIVRKLFGIPYQVATYLVERRSHTSHRDLVLLAPLRRWTGWSAPIAALLEGKQLRRLEPSHNGFTRLKIQTKQGLQISTAETGKYAVATISAEIDDALSTIARVSSTNLTPSQVISMLDESNIVRAKCAASPLVLYHRQNSPHPTPTVYPTSVGARVFSHDVKSIEDPKPAMQAFMSPLMHEAFVPSRDKASEARAVSGRITGVRAPIKVLTPFIDRVFDEFLTIMIPEPHTLTPVDLDTVYEKQSRPSQRNILRNSEYENPGATGQSFVKAEAYGAPKDQRLISTINGVHKREYSQYMYPFSDILKEQHWYAFGKSEASIAQRVTEICSSASTVIQTDFSRFDGTLSNVLREFEKRAILRAFRPEYHSDIIRLLQSQHNISMVCKNGTKYKTGYARASGSPETSSFNSLDNAIVAFTELRDGSKRTALDDFKGLGIYGGDDGLTPNADPKTYEIHASRYGLKLTAETLSRGQPGVSFLARIYSPDVWFGETSSMCDIRRQLSKLHVTQHMPSNVTPSDKLYQKCQSFSLTDINTPVLGPLCTKVLSVITPSGADTSAIARWHPEMGDHYPNHYGDWMMDHLFETIPDIDLPTFTRWLDEADETTILAPPLITPHKAPKVKERTVVDGNIVTPREHKKTKRRKSPSKRIRKR